MKGRICKCGHKEGYHSQSSQNQKFVCRGAFCDCVEFQEIALVSDTEDSKQIKKLGKANG